MNTALWWLGCNLLSIIALAFYSMVEMAIVSINKARLYFYAIEGNRAAHRLQELLLNPSKLFGTTLVGVNLATVIGSECAREFHASLGINPDFAPISQVILVVIFGELAPMFAARSYSEHVALLGSGLLTLSAKVLTPLLWTLDLIIEGIEYLMGGKETLPQHFLGKEELQKMLETQEEAAESNFDRAMGSISSSLFKLHTQTVREVMSPLEKLLLLPSQTRINQLRAYWKKKPSSSAVLYGKDKRNIVGTLHPRNVLKAKDEDLARDYARSPWFVTATTTLTHMIRQFRRNNQDIAIVLDEHGNAIGFTSLNAIVNEVFSPSLSTEQQLQEQADVLLVEKTLPATMTVGAFKELFGTLLDSDESLTLGELIIRQQGHHPNVGDSIHIGSYLFTIKATTLLDIKSVSVTGRT